MTRQTLDRAVRKTIVVAASRERAFEVFTAQMGSWWPLASKSIGGSPAQTAVLEPHAGGRWFERDADGRECEWGQVIAYDPPGRMVLGWQIGADWRYDPAINSEVEIRFIAEGDARTRVELEHRGLQTYGDAAEQMQQIFDSPDGWTSILGDYARAVST